MKKSVLLVTLLLSVCMIFSFAVDQKGVRKNIDKPMYVADEIVVTYESDAVSANAASNIQSKYGLTKKGSSFKPGKFTVYKHSDPDKILNQLRKEPGVKSAERNGIAYACWVPNDPYYSPYQWHLTRIGMEQTWPITTGTGVVVAVIDTGVKQSLADLANTNFMAGYDFANSDNDPTDDDGHGSHVCGTIAQSTNNGVGVAGIAYGCTIMPIKVLGADGSGSYTAIANGITYAVDHGADIINMSLGGYSSTTILQDAVNYAWNNGVVVVCAAGNDNVSTAHYPSAYTNSISVAATGGSNDAKASYSNYGSTIDICAPGGDTGDYNGDGYDDMILQNTFSGTSDGYYFFAGTSMACPHVAGVAALVKAANPSFTNTQIRAALENTAEDLGTAGWDQYFGKGMVDAYAAVNGSVGPVVNSYVYDVTCTVKKVLTKYQATGVVTIKNTNGNAVANATVTIAWSGAATGTASGTTNSSGQATFLTAKKSSRGPYTITVTNVTHATYPYNSALNVKTSASATY